MTSTGDAGDLCDCETCTVDECDYCGEPSEIVTEEYEVLCRRCHQRNLDNEAERAGLAADADYYGGSSESAESLNIRGAW